MCQVNIPTPDMSLVSAKIDTEGVEVVHLHKNIKVNKGKVPLDGIQVSGQARSWMEN